MFAIRLLNIEDRYTELVLKTVSDRLTCTRVSCQKKPLPKQLSHLYSVAKYGAGYISVLPLESSQAGMAQW